jgi:hypothetical protein
MTAPAYQISQKSTDWFKSYWWGDTDRQVYTQTDRLWFDKTTFKNNKESVNIMLRVRVESP